MPSRFNPPPPLVPNPDPSVRTVEQLHRDTQSVREVLEGRLEGLKTAVDARLDGMDKAIILLQDITNRTPTTGETLAQYGERLASIAEKFNLTDRITQEHFSKIDQQFRDQTSATALALSAAEKAIDNAFGTAEKAVAKAELAAEKGYLQSEIAALREAFTTQIATQKEAIVAALAASDKAVLKAEASNEKRFESVNEFRGTLADQQRELATKSEVDLRFKSLEDRMNAVVEDFRETKGRSSVSDPAVTEAIKRLNDTASDLGRSRDQGMGRAGVMDPQLAAALAEVKALRSDERLGSGHSKGLSDGWGFLVGGIGTLIAIATIAIAIVSRLK